MSLTLIGCKGRFWFGPAPSQLNVPEGFEVVVDEKLWLRLREIATGKVYYAGLSDDGRFVERLTKCGIATNGQPYADERDVLLTEHGWPDAITDATNC